MSSDPTATFEYFSDASAALNSSGDIYTPLHKYSTLGRMESFRDSDGLFHIIMSSATIFESGCLNILRKDANSVSGQYYIQFHGLALLVWCDMVTDGGGYVDSHVHVFDSQDKEIKYLVIVVF